MEYRLRRNSRAKSARWRVTIREGLVVTIPRRFPRRRVEELVRSNEPRIKSAFQLVEEEKKRLLPAEIQLRALDHVWSVDYSDDKLESAVVESGSRLVVTADPGNPLAVIDRIGLWLSSKAKQHLVPQIQKASGEVGLPFKKVTIRRQKTRWGSCSKKGTINLNRALLFFPPHLVRYVMVHELCHTEHLDHSGQFWKLVERWEPNCRALKREMAGQWKLYVPDWALI